MNTSTATKSVEDNVKALETVCHVVEVKDAFALVHASPNALAQIIGNLGFTVSPSKKGGDYYAVRLGAVQAAAPAPQARPVARPVAVAPKAAPVARSTSDRLNINGTGYVVSETATKRSQDARRWELSKVGDEAGKPYVVTFQDSDGCTAQCSCPDWIYRRHTRPDPDCKHCKAVKAAFGRQAAVA